MSLNPDQTRLARRLGIGDAVMVGLGSMIGAGVFAAIGPASQAAGAGLLIGLALAGALAYCNATSSAQLAALHPESGGTYVYGRERLGAFWGYLAGWGFVVGKLASCAAMALTFGVYVAPRAARPLAVAAVVALAAVNLRGVRKTARVTRVIVAFTLGALGVMVVGALAGGQANLARLGSPVAHADPLAVLQAAGILFFAFAGYARIATLGEEVTDPSRTIPRAIPIALGITLAVYVLVAVSALLAVGPERLARTNTPLVAAVEAGRLAAVAPVVRAGAAVASLGVLLSLLAGVSRTAFAMAAGGDLPRVLGAVHPRHRIPHRAEIAVAALVAVATATLDLREAIGFSSVAVLAYYAITNASALTLSSDERRWPRWIAATGVVGCVAFTASLPLASVIGGGAVLGLGAAVYGLRKG